MNTNHMRTEVVLCPKCGSPNVETCFEKRKFTVTNRLEDMVSYTKTLLQFHVADYVRDGFNISKAYHVASEQWKCQDCGYTFKKG